MNKQVEEVVEWVAESIYSHSRIPFSGTWARLREEEKRIYYRTARQILSNPKIRIEDDDQSLPDNLVWHKVEREFEAYCAGQNEVLAAKFVRVI